MSNKKAQTSSKIHSRIARGRRGMFICSKLGQNLSEMEVRTFVRIEREIWDHLLAFKAEIIQKAKNPYGEPVCRLVPYSFFLPLCNTKQLLDEVFVISRIIKVEVRVISRSRRLRLITLNETLIILDITKTESNNCFIIH